MGKLKPIFETEIQESDKALPRRDFLKSLLAGISVLVLDWDSFPAGKSNSHSGNSYDVIIIGAGLGGLSCGAAFARQNFRPLILEQHTIPGGYATTFRRPGGFIFDVSLHSTTVGERQGLHNLIPGFPEIKDVEFVPHPFLYRAIFPGYDFRVPQKNPAGYAEILTRFFPDEKEGIEGLMGDMTGLAQDIKKYSQSGGKVNMATFPQDFPFLFKTIGKTWGQMVDARIKDAKLKAMISSLWGYYGLPPSMLSAFYYALPTIGYLQEGGYYPRGRSQAISNALVKFIQKRGGTVKLGCQVEKVLVQNRVAIGVKTADGEEYQAKVVIANANPVDLFEKMIDEKKFFKDYLERLQKLSVSLSSFQVFLGLKRDLVGKLRIPDSEIFYSPGFNMEVGYKAMLEGNIENCGFGIMLYDNIYKGYSPPGKNTVNIMTLQGYERWARFESDYRKGKKKEYRAEKERMANILIKKVEEVLLPGLSKAIEIKEIGTPLTNWRYTKNYRGAIYGWNQTIDNSGLSRLPHTTPIKNLYLVGAWTQPGHGYSAVISSGLQCFAEIIKNWSTDT